MSITRPESLIEPGSLRALSSNKAEEFDGGVSSVISSAMVSELFQR